MQTALLSLTLPYTHFVLIHSSVITNMQMDGAVKDLLDIYMRFKHFCTDCIFVCRGNTW